MKQQLSNHGIGASEIAAVVGLNPYASPWDVWLRKTGQAPDVESNEPMEWGNRLEPAIRQKYVDEVGWAVYVPTESIFHPTTKWARATPDGIIPFSSSMQFDDPRNWSHLLQCKNVGEWPGKAWRDAPPVYVQLQEAWEMYVTGLTRADVAALIGGNQFRIYTVHRDDKMIADLVTIASDFWRKVETRTEPSVDESEACQKHFERKYTKAQSVELVADADLEQYLAEWRTLHEQHRNAEKRIKVIRNVMRRQLAEAQADRIVSNLGTVTLSKPGEPGEPSKETDWQLIAQLLGSTKCANDEYQSLVESATKTVETKARERTLYAPKEWKESQ